MTAQISERLHYQGKEYRLTSCPLDEYFGLAHIDSPFASTCTALWRGYIGHWEIVNDRLYLIKLTINFPDDDDVSLEIIFPGYPDRVFAHWFSPP